MAVQKEIKSQLAKLLATEDIIVEHKQCETAQFNVHTRVLTLPMWEKASNHVYDMLVGHEVGHALFTPDEDWTKDAKIPAQFINVVEDARIEKLMKRKYMGIAKSFYRGYSELHEKDFFELDGEDLNNFNLADRANLYFKIGSFFDLSFSTPEEEIITLIQNAETFTDTISAAETLYNFCKQEQQQKTSKSQENLEEDLVDEPASSDSSGTGDSDSDGTGDNGSSVSDSNSDGPVESGKRNPDNSSGSHADDPTVETAEAFNSSMQDLINYNGTENVYVERPDLNIENIIVSNKEIHKEADYHFSEQVIINERYKKENGYVQVPSNIYEEVDADFAKFKRDAQKEVSYLVKEFECKKAADSYARATTSRTGVLSTEKLHTYKFNEDLFKKISVVPDGKNHGLVFILDWSGSMADVMQDTIKQLYNLIWFCRKVSIPFEVYAFTNEWNNSKRDETGQIHSIDPQPLYEAKEHIFQVDNRFALMNLFTSKVNAKTLEHQLLNIWRTVSVFGFRKRYNSYYNYPHKLCLSGTPLNETLLSLYKILPEFQKENKLQKVQCIILTDGEASQLPYHKEVTRHWEDEPYLGCRNINPSSCFFRDRKVGKTYKIGYGYPEFTDMLIENLKDNYPSINFIGIRVLETRDAKYFIKRYYDEWKNPREYEKIVSEWRKAKAFTIKKSAYDAYFGMSSSALSADSEFDVEDSATKAQIKKAFVKSLKIKKLNKKILGEFIELVV